MNVLVTGGLGFIGSHTVIALHEAGYTPVIIDNLSNSSEAVLTQLSKITGHSFKFYRGCIGNDALMQQILTDHKIGGVFHFAALKAVGESTEKPLAYYRNNVSNTVAMLETMAKCGVERIVFSSSATVYGDPQYLPLDENHPISSTNPYGWTKVLVERVLQDYCVANDKMLAIALRYFNPVGAHPSGELGESPKGTPNNLMPYIAQTAVGIREHLNIFGDDYDTHDGTGVRDYIHVQDLVSGHVAAFDVHVKDSGFHAYNLGTGQGYSVLDMVKAFASSAETKIAYKICPRRDGDVASNYADASKAREVLNWHAKHDLKAMTDDTWRWQTNYPKGLE
ncbi:MAG: UDP-glucose 4-epimerase GalE [Psychrobium sp.]